MCGITNEEDALLAVALGANAVGFVFAPSPRQISMDRARDIARRLPSDVMSVGVFRNETPERVVQITNRAGMGAAQLHGHESVEQTTWVGARVPVTIKAFPAGHPDLEHLRDFGVEIVLLDGPRPGSGEVFDWSFAEGAPLAGHRLLLAGGLNPGNVAAAIKRVKPWGVDVSTGVEARPGRKDPLKMRVFIDVAQQFGSSTKDSRSDTVTDLFENSNGGSDTASPYDWASDARG